MYKYLLIPATCCWLFIGAQAPWKPAPTPLLTRWAADVRPDKVLPEYPRPQLVRKKWINLNGLWNYAIAPTATDPPVSWDGQILVPFCIESALSGVGRRVGPAEKLWYQRSIQIPASWKKNRILLHFEAVDWETEVLVDGQRAGSHRGGYDPFYFDITPLVRAGQNHVLTVTVRDPTDSEFINPRGKQVQTPGGIFYTPVTGIWQTVWLEAVPAAYISDYRVTTDIHAGTATIQVQTAHAPPGFRIEGAVAMKGRPTVTGWAGSDGQLMLTLPSPALWSPAHPDLYSLQLTLYAGGKKTDRIKGYFGMREVRLAQQDGMSHILLNDSLEFQHGPLDQGYWPDGIYTAPTDEALRFDIESTRQMGFNMLRKHVKVESRRFYYWCDRLGIWVWQDMPSTSGYIEPGQPDLTFSNEHREHFQTELRQMIASHFNHPSIIMWVIFNEGWGQHDTRETADYAALLDPTRLINNASGWEDRDCGHIRDIHHYPDPQSPPAEPDRAIALGEYGGLGLAIPSHTWQKENWGYQSMKDRDQLLATYEHYTANLHRMRDQNHLSAAVYTQTTDVETETNGLLTYDRAMFKMDPDALQKIHRGWFAPLFTTGPDIFTERIDVAFEPTSPGVQIYYTTDGSTPTASSRLYTDPFPLLESATVQAVAIHPTEGFMSRIASRTYTRVIASPSLMFIRQPDAGLSVQAYEGEWNTLPDFNQLRPVRSGTSARIGVGDGTKDDLIGLSYRGYIAVPTSGVYTFYVTSDDGSRLTIAKKAVVDHDGLHGATEKAGYAALQAGYHEFRLDFFEKKGGEFLEVEIEGPGITKQILPGDWMYH